MNTYGKELLVSLMAARKEMSDPAKSGRNTHMKYDYAKYEDMVKATAPFLMKHGLVVTETKKMIDLVHELLITRLEHIETNQFIPCESIINRHSNDQDYGKCITYAKKYAYGTLVGVSCGDDSDADGDREYITKEQLETIIKEINEIGAKGMVLAKEICEKANIKYMKELYATDFDKVMDLIKKHKVNK